MTHIAASLSPEVEFPVISGKQIKSERLSIIDMLRGVAMLMMALLHSASMDGTDYNAVSFGRVMPKLASFPHVLIGLIAETAPDIFFTLAGTSVAFFENSRRKRGWTEWQITRFLMIRALVLAVLDKLMSHFAWHEATLTFDVLSALAFALVILSVNRLIPLRLIAVIAVVFFFGYQLVVDHFPFDAANPVSTADAFLYQFHEDGAPHVEFPALARMGLVLGGYVLGRLMIDKKITITSKIFGYALAFLVAAAVLRALGGYGNFTPYQSGQPFIYFFIESKQPPGLVFQLFNIAKALIILGLLHVFAAQLANGVLGKILVLLGQTALFFYVAHLLIYSHVTSRIIPMTFLGDHSILRDWVEWGIGLAILIPMCAAYRELRRRYPNSPLQYL